MVCVSADEKLATHSESYCTKPLERRSYERMAVLLVPLHIQHTECNVMHCPKHHLQCTALSETPTGNATQLHSDAAITRRKGTSQELLSKCRPKANLEASYLIMFGKRRIIP